MPVFARHLFWGVVGWVSSQVLAREMGLTQDHPKPAGRIHSNLFCCLPGASPGILVLGGSELRQSFVLVRD